MVQMISRLLLTCVSVCLLVLNLVPPTLRLMISQLGLSGGLVMVTPPRHLCLEHVRI